MMSGEWLREQGGKGSLRPDNLDRALARARRPLDRAYERRALPLASMAELSADVGARLSRPPRARGPRILVASLRGWSTHNAYELLIAQALRLRGAQVALLTCGGGMPACELGWGRRAHPRPCDRCAWLTGRVVDVAGLRHYALGELLPWGADARRAPAQAPGEGAVDPYATSAISVVSLLKSTELEHVAGAREIVEDFAVAAGGVERAAGVILDEFAPTIVFMLNGLFAAERVIRELARAREIRCPTYELAPRGGTLVLSQSDAAPDYNVDRLWASVRDRPLEERQRAEVLALLNDRARGIGAHESYYEQTESDHDRLRRQPAPAGPRARRLAVHQRRLGQRGGRPRHRFCVAVRLGRAGRAPRGAPGAGARRAHPSG